MLGYNQGGTNHSGDPRPPHLGPGRGWGEVSITPGSHHGKITLSALHLPALDLPPPSPSSSFPSPFLPPEPPALRSSPSPPGGRHAWLCRQAAGEVTHLPALPARLPERAGAASVSLRVKRKILSIPGQSSEVEAASSWPRHLEPPCPRCPTLGCPLVTRWGSASHW